MAPPLLRSLRPEEFYTYANDFDVSPLRDAKEKKSAWDSTKLSRKFQEFSLLFSPYGRGLLSPSVGMDPSRSTNLFFLHDHCCRSGPDN